MDNMFKNINFKPEDVKKSILWYKNQIKNIGNINSQSIMKQQQYLVNRIIPGKMYLFFYDPKFKNTLPYYDQFPLVLPFRKIESGFLGLNLHYLPYGSRFKILGYLFDYISNDNMDETTKLNISWRILNSSAKLDPIKACVKHYLSNHVKSRFFEIPINNWLTVSLLPLEKFEGANKQKIWNDSKKTYQ